MYVSKKFNAKHLVIDHTLGIETLDDADLFLDMLKRFEPDTLFPCLERLKKGIEEKDNAVVRKESHTLKGSSGYIAAMALSETAKEMQFAIDKNEIEKGYGLYSTLIEAAIETKLEIKKYICFKENITFQEEEKDYQVPIAKGYKWEKKSNGDIFVYLEDTNQPILESLNSKNQIPNMNQLESEQQVYALGKKAEVEQNANIHRNNHKESNQEFPSYIKNNNEFQKNSSLYSKAKQSGGIIEEGARKKEENQFKANNYKSKSKLPIISEDMEKRVSENDPQREISERNFENYSKNNYKNYEEPIQRFEEVEDQKEDDVPSSRKSKSKSSKKSKNINPEEENLANEAEEEISPSRKKKSIGSQNKKKMQAEKAGKEGGSCCCIII